MSKTDNPLLRDWTTPYGLPPFEEISHDHILEAFDFAIEDDLRETKSIADNSATPDFANTIEGLERSGRYLRRVCRVVFNLTSAHTNEELQKIEREISPRLAKHYSELFMDRALFERIDQLYSRRSNLDLSPEQDRVLERYHTLFVRSGAKLSPEAGSRMAAINEKLAYLGTLFSQNVLKDESDFQLVLGDEKDLAGLPGFLRRAAAQCANESGHPGKHVITLARSSIEPFLKFSERRDLREKAFKAWTARGSNAGETNNAQIIREMVELRIEKAQLLGFETYAQFKLDDNMAKTPEAVHKLLMAVWDPARGQALEDRDALLDLVRREGGNFEIAAWDWHYYAEKRRIAEYDLDETEVKPYFQLDKMIEAAFYTANRLFGLRFEEVQTSALYHEDVRAWEVTDNNGQHVGLFLGDYFARPSKRSGAWMSSLRNQDKLDGNRRPIILNVLNFNKSAPGEPVLLSFDDARTLFHEFGHGLHGLLSDVTYPLISGTSVASDFVELPSQLYEHWLLTPEILRRFAVHAETGEVISDDLLERLLAARNFNQGFQTVEYLASGIVDLYLHDRVGNGAPDVETFEQDILSEISMPSEIVPRHSLPHFLHLFAGDGYAAGYYSYLWSEVMDADAFNAFEAAGDVFDSELAEKLREHIYSAGGRRDPADAYIAFRGRLPEIDALLEKRGFKAKVPAVTDTLDG